MLKNVPYHKKWIHSLWMPTPKKSMWRAFSNWLTSEDDGTKNIEMLMRLPHHPRTHRTSTGRLHIHYHAGRNKMRSWTIIFPQKLSQEHLIRMREKYLVIEFMTPQNQISFHSHRKTWQDVISTLCCHIKNTPAPLNSDSWSLLSSRARQFSKFRNDSTFCGGERVMISERLIRHARLYQKSESLGSFIRCARVLRFVASPAPMRSFQTPSQDPTRERTIALLSCQTVRKISFCRTIYAMPSGARAI